MQDDVLEHQGVGELRIRLAADAASVPGARRFVTDGLRAFGMPSLVDDAALCVTELAANAALHSGSTFMEVALRALEQSVRIVVEDDGRVPAEAVVSRASFDQRPGPTADDGPDLDDLGDLDLDGLDLALVDESTTGRGLGIVSVLAREWGVEDTGSGKRVWLTLDDSHEMHSVRPPVTGTTTAPVRDVDATLPDGWGLVRLEGCPVLLSLRQDQHLDELIRELQLLETDRDNPRSRALADRLAGLLSTPAHARHTGRRIAEQAAAEGRTRIDIDMAMPRELAHEVRSLQAAVQEADRLCDEMRLLTLSSSADLRELRSWMTDQVSSQLERGTPPVGWDAWRATRQDG